MTRWNVKTIFFFGVNGDRRDVNLVPGKVNIVTGASGTGKSALIKTLDYCLGASKCELPAYVRQRCLAVGVKWVMGEQELIVGRIVPPVGQATSMRMYVTSGRFLSLPDAASGFQGATNVETAKSILERAFGIGDVQRPAEAAGKARGRATIRHIPPYLFVTKEVIYSETVLLHGLDDRVKAEGIVDSLPYFLRAETESTALAERRLRQLRKGLEVMEGKERARTSAVRQLKTSALGLLFEASQLGLAAMPDHDQSEAQLLATLETLKHVGVGSTGYADESEIGTLYETRRKTLADLGEVKRERQAADIAIRDAEGFRSATSRQYNKLKLADYLKLDAIEHKCPLCDSVTEKGSEVARSLIVTFDKVRGESAAVGKVQPRLREYASALARQSDGLNFQLKQIDAQLRGLIRATEENQRLSDLAQVRAHFLGRVSFFMETTGDMEVVLEKDLSVLRNDIEELEAGIDIDDREIRLRHAESQISRVASEIFDVLPKVAPCNNAELNFLSRKPEVTMIERGGSGAILRMPDIGSDQNYLAIHISLSFALQRYFNSAKSPVPGLLVLDQVSRPYFPAQKDSDETLVQGEDEDVIAMRKHIDFLFSEVARNEGLQILLIEHAYFADDPRYVAATIERWTRASRLALIPLDWPTRPDK